MNAQYDEGRLKRGREWYADDGRRSTLIEVARQEDVSNWEDWYPDLCSALEASEKKLKELRESITVLRQNVEGKYDEVKGERRWPYILSDDRAYLAALDWVVGEILDVVESE